MPSGNTAFTAYTCSGKVLQITINLESISLTAAMQIASLINTVPCGGHAFSSQCPLLEQARNANSEIAGKEVQYKHLKNRYRAVRADYDAANNELQRLLEGQQREAAPGALRRRVAREPLHVQRMRDGRGAEVRPQKRID